MYLILNYIYDKKITGIYKILYLIYLINELRTYITQDNTRIIIVFTKNSLTYICAFLTNYFGDFLIGWLSLSSQSETSNIKKNFAQKGKNMI